MTANRHASWGRARQKRGPESGSENGPEKGSRRRRLAWVARALVAASLLANAAAAQLCTTWSEAETLGTLDEALLPEASGVAASSRFPGRLYHVNDSGGGPFFYLTDLSGARTERVRLEGLGASAADPEDLSLGPCPGGGSCLFVADIGDNLLRRETLEILVVPEQESYGDAVRPLHRVRLAYPDGPHDAEGFAVHPGGDFYLLTKARVSGLQAAPARLYTLPAERWQGARDVERLDFVTELDLRAMSGLPFDFLSHIATALDISPDGERLLVLSYGNAFELRLASVLAGGRLEADRDYRRVAIRRLPQQESASYLPNGRDFVYSSERRGDVAPELLRVNCLEWSERE